MLSGENLHTSTNPNLNPNPVLNQHRIAVDTVTATSPGQPITFPHFLNGKLDVIHAALLLLLSYCNKLLKNVLFVMCDSSAKEILYPFMVLTVNHSRVRVQFFCSIKLMHQLLKYRLLH